MGNAALKLVPDYVNELGEESLLQGNLQNMFDALYQMGVIDPVLEMDWVKAMESAEAYRHNIDSAIHIANNYESSVDELVTKLGSFDDTTLGYLAMEVAREFADFHSRKEIH